MAQSQGRTPLRAGLGPSETPYNRIPREETLLFHWLRRHGVTRVEFARRMRVHHTSVTKWVDGRALPSLVNSFRIEKETRGEVPVASWMGTVIAQLEWNAVSSANS